MPTSDYSNFGKLPPRVLNRTFEYLFWIGMCDDEMKVFTSVPLGHKTILPCLQVNHSWRKRAARLFYGFVSIVVGCGHTAFWEIPTRYDKNLALRTNVRLILESGYAPKATHLSVYSNSTLQPMQMSASLDRTGFLDYVWENIHMLYFFHPQGLKEPTSAGLWDQDRGIAQVNDWMARSLPNMTSMKALSNTRDSFGLFGLDDLINARLDNMAELVVLSHGSLVLGAQEFPSSLRRLVIRTTMGVNRERNADDSHLDNDTLSEEIAFAGSEDNPTESETSSIVSSSVGGGAASSYSSSHLSRQMHRKSASTNGSAQVEKVVALRIPRICAESLVFLELGPISPENIWDPFIIESYINAVPLVFSNLKTLNLVFSSPLLTNAEQKWHPIRHHLHHSHWPSRRRSSATSDSSSVREPHVQFPCLESLSLTAYPHDIDDILDIFPCAQLRNFELVRCPHGFFRMSLENSFTQLAHASIDIPRARNRKKDQDIDDWISKTLGSRLLCLKTLSLSTPSDYTGHVELPVDYGVTNIQHLKLTVGLKLVEIEKLLSGLPNLRTLNITVTEVMGEAHEYLSRTAHPKRYPSGQWTWRRDRHSVLSISLEEIVIRYSDLSHSRLKRAVCKTVMVASRVPSILRISTQPLYLDMLRECVTKIANDKLSTLETHHLNGIQLVPIVGIS
ncbi:hypothetical protein LPJ81_002868 [Coemansia sp. IMI 209127]|nr:hypothetical protein LPJ81_002868 [Coemansia sp. IMI 209127]